MNRPLAPERAREVVETLQQEAVWQVPCESCGQSSYLRDDIAEEIIAAALRAWKGEADGR